MDKTVLKIICPVCFCGDVLYLGRKNNFKLYKSFSCGLIFVWPLPGNVTNLYCKEYFKGMKNGLGFVDYERDKEPMRRTFMRFLEEIGKYAPRKGVLLDVGAANGHFMKIARDGGWQIKGVEISEYASNEGRKHGLDIVTGTVHSPELSEGEFNAITMLDVLEHLQSPEKDIRRCYSLLKEGGLLAINTPDSASLWARLCGSHWQLIVPPEHLFLFSKKSLEIVLNRNDFEILSIRRIGKSLPLAYFFAFGHRWLGLKIFKWLAKLCDLKIFRWISIPLNLRDNMFIVARKKK